MIRNNQRGYEGKKCDANTGDGRRGGSRRESVREACKEWEDHVICLDDLQTGSLQNVSELLG